MSLEPTESDRLAADVYSESWASGHYGQDGSARAGYLAGVLAERERAAALAEDCRPNSHRQPCVCKVCEDARRVGELIRRGPTT